MPDPVIPVVTDPPTTATPAVAPPVAAAPDPAVATLQAQLTAMEGRLKRQALTSELTGLRAPEQFLSHFDGAHIAIGEDGRLTAEARAEVVRRREAMPYLFDTPAAPAAPVAPVAAAPATPPAAPALPVPAVAAPVAAPIAVGSTAQPAANPRQSLITYTQHESDMFRSARTEPGAYARRPLHKQVAPLMGHLTERFT